MTAEKKANNVIGLSKSKKWGVPNWRNASEYEFADPENKSPLINDQLRWEFLRRDQDYKAAWRDPEKSRFDFGLIEPIDPKLPARALKGRSIFFIDSVMRGGLVSMSAPRVEDPNEFIKSYGKHILELEHEGFLIVGFDPHFSVRPQIDQAEKILTRHRKEAIVRTEQEDEGEYREIISRARTPEIPHQLLRVLDAHNEGATPLEIGRVIFFLTNDDADGTAHARAVAHERLIAAKDAWRDMSPPKRNVVL